MRGLALHGSVPVPPPAASLPVRDPLETWRRRVRRLARVFIENREERFVERTCECGCGLQVMCNADIYPDDEPVRHDDIRLYQPDAPLRRDGYWYAIALEGRDPEGRGGFLTPWRRRQLQAECERVGFEFGEALRG